jgi:predicted nucleotidyltransferase
MITLDTLRGKQREAIVALGSLHGATSMRVFGSVARGQNDNSSDVDFLVEFEKGRTLFDLIRLRLALKDLLGTEVEVVTPATLHYLRDRVLSEAQYL